MGFLDGLLETKAKKNVNAPVGNADSINRAIGAATVNSGQGLGNVGSWDADKAIRAGYERVIWIFRCVDVIATNQANLVIDLHKGMDREGGELIENERLTRLLNFRANTYESSWQFRYRLSSQVLLSRRGAFIEIVPGKGNGEPAELHLLPVGKTKPIPDSKTFVSGYEVTGQDGQTTTLKPEQVIWVRAKPHPLDPYSQMTPLVAAGIEADTDVLARTFNRNFLSNDGRPGMLVTINPGETNLQPKDVEVLRQRFGGGVSQAGLTTVLEAAGVSAQDMSASPRDTQWAELLAASKERLLMAFGVPESIMGNASGRTYDNADAERENFWMDTMVPHCNNLAFSLDPLTGDVYDDQVFGYRYDEVDVLQRQKVRKREEWRTEVQSGLRTVDEYFAAVGREEWNRPETRILMNGNGVFTGRNDEDSKAADVINQKRNAAPAPAGGASPTGDIFNGQVSALERATSKWGNQIAARALAIGKDAYDANMETKAARSRQAGRAHRSTAATVTPDEDDEVEKKDTQAKDDDHDIELEAFLEGVLSSWDTRMMEVLPERLNHAKVRKGTRHWEGAENAAVKALDAGYVVDTQKWLDDAQRSIQARLGRSYRAAAKRELTSLRQMGATVPQISDSVYEAGINEITAVAESAINNQMTRVQDRIRVMEDNGSTLKQIEAEVRKMLGARARWRKLLAMNVATAAIEKAKHDVHTRTKGTVPVWRSSADERVRKSHRHLDGKRAQNGVFTTPSGATLRFPGDPMAPPGETVNCRCWLDWTPDYRRLG